MKALIMYENVPEETVLYAVEDPTEDELRIFRGAAGHYINHDDTDECIELAELLVDSKRFVVLDTGTLIEGPFDLICVTGVVL